MDNDAAELSARTAGMLNTGDSNASAHSLKHSLRSGLDQLSAATKVLQWYERRMRRGLTILMYHRVLPREHCTTYPLPALIVPVDVFRRQLHWLANHCNVMTLQDALQRLSAQDMPPKPLVSITFDDGYYDNFDVAAPVLEDFGLRGTFFVTSGFVDGAIPQWYDRAAVAWQQIGPGDQGALIEQLSSTGAELPAGSPRSSGAHVWMGMLKRTTPAVREQLIAEAESLVGKELDLCNYRPMSPEKVKALHDRGHEIGSHTVSHAILPQLSDDSIRAELRGSAEQLRAWTGHPVTGFCYPNGDYDVRVERAVREADYSYACTVEEGMNYPGQPHSRLSRVPVTMQRTMHRGDHDELGFRAELCRLRAAWRR